MNSKPVKQSTVICGYCLLTVCQKCISLNHNCHSNDNGRTICSTHSKNNRVIDIPSSRILGSVGQLQAKHHNLFTQYVVSSNNVISNKIFNSFYSDFNGTAHFYEINDHNDTELWKSSLPYTGVYLFKSAELAKIALQYFPNLKAIDDLNDIDTINSNLEGNVQFQICYQCNCYQAHHPFMRTFKDPNIKKIRQDNISRTVGPNFYSDSLCRKSNTSHDKKKKGNRQNKKVESITTDTTSNNKSLASTNVSSIKEEVIDDTYDKTKYNDSNAKSQEAGKFDDLLDIQFNDQVEPSPFISFWSINLSPLFFAPSPRILRSNYDDTNRLPELGNIDIFNSKGKSIFPTTRRDSKLFNEKMYYLNGANNSNNVAYSFLNEKISTTVNEISNPFLERKRKLSVLINAEKKSKLNNEDAVKKLEEFDEALAWELLSDWKFFQFRTYLNSHPIDPKVDPLNFSYFELVKLYTCIEESLEGEFIGAFPSVPKTNGVSMKFEELYQMNQPPIDSSVQNVKELLCLDMIYSGDKKSYDRVSLIGELSATMKDLYPVLSSIESVIAKREPLYHIIFRYLYYFYVDLGKFDFSKFPQTYDIFLNNYCTLMVESYYLYEYYLNNGGKSESLVVIKNMTLLFQAYFCGIITRARLLDLRSRATLTILKARKDVMSSLLNSNTNRNVLDTVLEYTDYNTLENFCMPESFKWLDINEILQYIICSSFSSAESFTLDFKNVTASCNCAFRNVVCTHNTFTSSKHQNFNFCLSYMPSRIFLEFGLNSLEEHFTKIYILHMNKLQFNHEFLPVDVNLMQTNVRIPPITPANLNGFAESIEGPSSIYRQHPIFSGFHHAALSLKSEIDGSKIKQPSKDEILLYRNSLPVLEKNSLSIESSLEETQTWTKLALQLAYISRDVYAVTQASLFLIRNYLYVAFDYENGITELEKLIQFHFGSLLLLPSVPSNLFMRYFVQNNIIREQSLLVQYQKHVLAGLTSLFFPGELMNIIVDGKFRDVIYLTFELTSRPIYLTNIESLGGDCWSVVGCDLSLAASWRSVSLDNISMQYNGATIPLMSQRFLIHSLRIGEYSAVQFANDLNARDKVVVN